jgi:hypothetical protein
VISTLSTDQADQGSMISTLSTDQADQDVLAYRLPGVGPAGFPLS